MKKYGEENPIRRLRKALGLNQANFGRLIDRVHQSVQTYETGGIVPDDVIDRLKTLAVERGLAPIALELSSDDWRVRTVIHPPAEFAARLAPPIPVDPRRQQWHAYLDAILDSRNEKAIHAVQSNLLVFHDYVAGSSPKLVPAQSPKNSRNTRPKVG